MVNYKNVPEFPGYRVGDDGSVWSCWRVIGIGYPHGTRSMIDASRWRPLKIKTCRKTGYASVALRRNGEYKHFLVHRLVLQLFVGPCPPKMECMHINGVRTDNIVTNLRWGTRLENSRDKFKHGTMAMGETIASSKMTVEKIRSIRSKYETGISNQVELAKEFGITQANVSEIVRRKTWKHVE